VFFFGSTEGKRLEEYMNDYPSVSVCASARWNEGTKAGCVGG
jgi:hypothetical protein